MSRSVMVDVDVSDILIELSQEELLEEMQLRGWLGASKSDVELVLEYLQRGDVAEATLLLERAIYPKFRTAHDAKTKLNKIMKGAH